MAISPLQDDSCQPAQMADWRLLTSAGFDLESIDAGHMDCLQPQPVPVQNDVEPECPFLSGPEMKRVAQNFAKVQALHSAPSGRCELFELICKDIQQFMA
eukprot:TRINITY_DN112518_c0_g1_i1.p1 TRINITY_DN112518_c0_g1~~TRINITY_DN112518_c0_g1_i1.p1  ORF type:complete len:115 (-),score=24.21 TRINITY_DN112518_c0_g1_i1:16-315(-)